MRLAIFLIFAIYGGLAHSAESKLKTELALNWKPEPQFGGFYAAERIGAFKKHGLDVHIAPGGAGTPVVQMVASGKTEFGIASADEVVIAQSHGAKVVALFAAYQTNPQGIMTHAERSFKSIKDVMASEGVLAIQKGLPYAQYLLKKYPSPKTKIVPYLGGITNFIADAKLSQQCFVTSEPLSASRKGLKEKTFLVAEEAYNPYTTVLVTHSDVIAKKPELVKAVVASVREGWTDYLNSPDETNKVMQKLNPSMDAETFKESARAQMRLIIPEKPNGPGLGDMTTERWQQLVDQLSELKLIDKKPVTAELFKQL